VALVDVSDIRHAGQRAWIEEMATLCEPSAVELCDGSDEEYDRLERSLAATRSVSGAMQHSERPVSPWWPRERGRNAVRRCCCCSRRRALAYRRGVKHIVGVA
jgi:phosphoenolpyruvate carboxykinase (GTP)